MGLKEVRVDISFLRTSSIPALFMLVPWYFMALGISLYAFSSVCFGIVQQFWPGYLSRWLLWPIYDDFRAILFLPAMLPLRILAYIFTFIGGFIMTLVTIHTLARWEKPWPRIHALEGIERTDVLNSGFAVALTQLFMSTSLSFWFLCPDGSVFGIPIPAYIAVIIALAMLNSAAGRRAEERAAAAAATEPKLATQADTGTGLTSPIPPATSKGDLMRFYSVVIALALHWANRPTSFIFLAATKRWQLTLETFTMVSAYYAAFWAAPSFLRGLVADADMHETMLEAALDKAIEEGWRDEDDLEDQVGGGTVQPLLSEVKDPILGKEEQADVVSAGEAGRVSVTEQLVDVA